MPTITAMGALKDISTLIALVDTGISTVHYLAPTEEMQLAARAFLQHAEPQLTNAMQANKAAMLNNHADTLSDSIKANTTREEWKQAKILM